MVYSKEELKAIGARIHEIRKTDNNLTLKQFADAIGAETSSVADNLEYGRIQPNPIYIRAISLTFKVREEWIYHGIEPKQIFEESIDSLIDTRLVDVSEHTRSLFKLAFKRDNSFIQHLNHVVNSIVAERETESLKHGKSVIDSVNQVSQTNFASLKTIKAINIITEEPVAEIPYFYRNASAGTGEYLQSELPSKMIKAYGTNAKANYAIGVTGDSMEPLYQDGDTLFVSACSNVNIGEVGVFSVDGNCYVKKQGDGVLISINKDYQDIPITEHTDFRCQGRVIGSTGIGD